MKSLQDLFDYYIVLLLELIYSDIDDSITDWFYISLILCKYQSVVLSIDNLNIKNINIEEK